MILEDFDLFFGRHQWHSPIFAKKLEGQVNGLYVLRDSYVVYGSGFQVKFVFIRHIISQG